MSYPEIKDKQRSDPTIREVIAQIVLEETPHPTSSKELPDFPVLLWELNRLELHNKVKYRKRQDAGPSDLSIGFPEKLRALVVHNLHMDQLGIPRTLVRTRFYWPLKKESS